MSFQKHISSEATNQLITYFLNHESDIFWQNNDFADLHVIFTELLDREPKEENYGV